MTIEGKVWDGTAWRTGIRVWDAGSVYPSRPAGWIDLADEVLGPAQWTFDTDAQGWTDNNIPGNPLEWSATDGRVIGTQSVAPSFFAAYSYAHGPVVKLKGSGPFKVRGTVACGITSGHFDPNDLKSMKVALNEQAWMSDNTLVEGEDTTLTGAWTVVETGLWTPPAPDPTVYVNAYISYSTGLYPPYGDALFRIHVNDATVLNADGSVAQRIITPAKVAKAWDGTRWVDFI
jgi:hypothetical protein